jgi:Uma2 family endonuclease
MQDPQEKELYYTYSDYVAWDDDTRYELVYGVPIAMTSPLHIHQRVVLQLAFLIRAFLSGKPCELFVSPSDVRLNSATKDNIVVQPDLFVVCDKTKLDGKACVGAPDLVIEVISPTSLHYDKLTKFQLYLNAGVKEYWIVNPMNRTVDLCLLENGNYVVSSYKDNALIQSHILTDFEVKLSNIFSVNDI